MDKVSFSGDEEEKGMNFCEYCCDEGFIDSDFCNFCNQVRDQIDD